MEENEINQEEAETRGKQCVELECEYCACNCRKTYVSCTYTDPYVMFPKTCPLNKW
jgi:hypothetical protein